MASDSTNSNNGSGTANSEPTKNGMMDYVPYFANGKTDAAEASNRQPMMQVQPAQGPPYNNYDGLPRNGFLGATITPSDCTVVSELTEDIRTVDVINPPGLKPLTSSNIVRMENGESEYTPKTDTWDTHEQGEEKDKDVKVTAWNSEGLNALKNSKKHRTKMICFALLFFLIVIAAISLGIGLSRNGGGTSSSGSQLPDGGGGSPTEPPGVPTSAPSTIPPVETASPTSAATTQAPVGPGETFAPTEEVTLPPPVDQPTDAPVPDPTQAPVPDPTEAPVPEPTEAPVPDPTQAPVPEPTEAPVDPPTDAPVEPPTGEDCTNTVDADKFCYSPSDQITVTYTVCDPDPTGEDWIGLYRNPDTLDPDSLGDARYWETICNSSWCRGPDPYVNTLVMGVDVSGLTEGTYGLFLVEGPDDNPPFTSFAQTTIEVSSNC